METLSPLLKTVSKLWCNWWLPFMFLISFSAFMSPGLSVFGYSLALLSLGIWIGHKSKDQNQHQIISPSKISQFSKTSSKSSNKKLKRHGAS